MRLLIWAHERPRSLPSSTLSLTHRAVLQTAKHRVTRKGVGSVSIALGAIVAAAGWGCSGGHRDQTELTGSELPSPAVTVTGIAADTPIVFRSDRAQPDEASDLFAMAPDGSAVVPLTQGNEYYFPAWSPDGQSLAFRASADGTSTTLEVMSADGGAPQVLDDQDTGFDSAPPRWSADGRNIAFGSTRDDEMHVWVLPSTGGTAKRLLPQLQGGEDTATWSWSDSSQIAFSGPLNAGENIWIVSADGSMLDVTQSQVFAPSYPRWSPDGTRLAFSGYARASDGSVEGLGDTGLVAPSAEIFVVEIATQELTRVTQDPAEDQTPVWSPDGKQLLFASDRDGDFDLWLVSLDDLEHPIDLIDDDADPHQDQDPDWYWPPPAGG